MARGRKKGAVSQRVMVQTAIQEKGWDAGPSELAAVIKEKFSTDLPNNVISNYKSNLKKEHAGGGGKTSGKKRGRPPGRRTGPAFADLEAMRKLVDRLGVDQVKELVNDAAKYT